MSYDLTIVIYIQLLQRSWYLIAVAIAGLRECRRLENFDFKSVNRISTVINHLKRLSLVNTSSNIHSNASNDTSNLNGSYYPSHHQPYHHQLLLLSQSQPEWLHELLGQVGITEISFISSMEELSKLFPRRLPQIVALWSVENPITYWDKVSSCMICLSVF